MLSQLRNAVAMDEDSWQKLVSAGITSIEELADFSTDELSEKPASMKKKPKN